MRRSPMLWLCLATVAISRSKSQSLGRRDRLARSPGRSAASSGLPWVRFDQLFAGAYLNGFVYM